MTYPTYQEVFEKSYSTATVPLPDAWQGDSIAVELADRECARLLVSTMFENQEGRHDSNKR